ncbi:MAG: 50S ribosomal protein L29 [Alphaproteobacteria bacterium]|nr:50S ribosomal protein L29 [Alphaproteobacteria bacterium]
MGTISEMSDQDLVARVVQAERDLVAARFKHSTNQLENTARLRNLRHEIARLRTEARTREIAQGLGKDALIQQHLPTTSAPAAGTGASEAKGGFLAGIVDKISGND